MSEKFTPIAPQMQLFFVLGAVQTLPTCILADSGSVQNFISKAIYKKLPYKPTIRKPEESRIVGGIGEPLDLKGFTVLRVTLGSTLLLDEF